MKYKIELVTMKDCTDFVNAVSDCKERVVLESGDFRVNAKSLIGALASTEWNDLYCVSDEQDLYTRIQNWIVN